MNYLFKRPTIVFIIIIAFLSLSSCNKIETPEIKISNIDYITPTTATVFVSITDDGGAEVTSRGVCWDTSENPSYSGKKTSDGKGAGAFSTSIYPLESSTQYFVRAYATNSEGVGYSKQDTVTTAVVPIPPVFESELVSYTSVNAYVRCKITNDNGSLITLSGICWSTGQNPSITGNHSTDGTIDGEYTSSMPGLIPDTKYFIKPYATTIEGIFYGNEISFTTLSESDGQVTDTDGNTYKVVVIGNQTWIAENLNVGIPIPATVHASDNGIIEKHVYNDDVLMAETYGGLYDWDEMMQYHPGDPGPVGTTQGICPVNWHLPTWLEFNTLFEHLGGAAGGKLKETGLIHWESPNSGATNTSGFTALPAGIYVESIYTDLHGMACFWFSDLFAGKPIWFTLSSLWGELTIWLERDKAYGLSVRCVKNPAIK